MLRKLIKYEFKATYKFMLLMYGLLIVMSAMISAGLMTNLGEAVNKIANRFNLGGMILLVFMVIFIILFVVVNIIVLCGMFFYAIGRFKNNLLGNEGYLMHTLPVKVRDNILSKVIVSVVWTLTGFVAALIAYFILFIGIVRMDLFRSIYNVFIKINQSNISKKEIMLLVEFFAELGLVALAGIISIYFKMYASMAVGFSFNTHKLAKSIGVFILLSVVTSIFEAIVMTGVETIGIEIVYAANIHVLLRYGIIITIAETVIYYFITHYFLNKRLNLQ